MILSLLALATLAAPVQEPSPADWAERLAGDERDAARAELLALGRRAADTLADVIDVGDDEAAWQAVALLAALGEDGSGSRGGLEKLLADDSRPPERRALAALGLGAVGPKNGKAAKELFEVLEERPAPVLSVAARVALGNLGKAAAGPASRAMRKAENVILRQYGAQVLYELGPEAAGERKALAEVLEDDHGYYLYALAKGALERIGEPAEKDLREAWAARSKVLPRQMGAWMFPRKTYESNADVMRMLRRKQAFGMENEDLPTERIPPTDEMALPERFEDFNHDGNGSVGEVFLVWAGHAAVELERLRLDLFGSSPPADLAGWRARALPLERTTEGLETLDPAHRTADE